MFYIRGKGRVTWETRSMQQQIVMMVGCNSCVSVFIVLLITALHVLPRRFSLVYTYIFVCWLVCQQDYTKATEWIWSKPGWRTGPSPGQSPVTSAADPGIFLTYLNTAKFDIFHEFAKATIMCGFWWKSYLGGVYLWVSCGMPSSDCLQLLCRLSHL